MEDWQHQLVDTDFMIEMLAANEAAFDYITKENAALYISVITRAELIRGARDKSHMTKIIRNIEPFTVIDMDSEISYYFNQLMEQYALSHQIGISDAIIAATALNYNLPLLTCNTKHLKYIKSLYLPAHGVKPQRKGLGNF